MGITGWRYQAYRYDGEDSHEAGIHELYYGPDGEGPTERPLFIVDGRTVEEALASFDEITARMRKDLQKYGIRDEVE